jgi:3'(2'), 5'-bisphosphate nucleotidase
MTDFSDTGSRRLLMDGLVAAALEAGAEIMRVFEAGFSVEIKSDLSPVTAADQAAEAVILAALARLAAEVPVVAEEEAAAGRIPVVAEAFFLVDPLDGTKEFVRRGSDFTVNIGLIQDHRPTLGVVFAPARAELYAGDARTGEAWFQRDGGARTPLCVRPPRTPPVALASRSHDVPATEAFLSAIGAAERISIGSSLKFCLLARGEADVYPRPSPTMEWDTAAGHAVLAAAGGRAEGPDGTPLLYGKPDFFNPGFLAAGALSTPPIGPFMAAAAASSPPR